MIMTGKEDAPSRSARFKIVVVGTSGAGSRTGDARQARGWLGGLGTIQTARNACLLG